MKKLRLLLLIAPLFFCTGSFAQVFANFSYSGGDCQTNTNVQFIDFSTSSGSSIVSWAWNFRDFGSGTNTSTLQNPTHTFTDTGIFTVTLIVTDNLGMADTITLPVQVKLAPQINYPPFIPVCQGSAPIYAATATITNGVAGFGNYYGVDSNNMYDPITSGLHTFNYVFTSTQGCSTSAIQTIIVDPKPQAVFTSSSTQQCVPATFTFANASSITTGTLTYLWDFNDGSVLSTNSNPSHVYVTAGNYNVFLIATSSAGCRDTAVQPITVGQIQTSTDTAVCVNQLPVLWHGQYYNYQGTYTDTLPASSGCDTVATLHLSIKPSTSSSTYIAVCLFQLPYLWNGNAYSSAGTYKDTLVNSFGCDSVATLHLTVTPFPDATFSSVFVDSLCSSHTVYFMAGSNADSYLWKFGDGNTSSLPNALHFYQNIGTYTVKLIAGNNMCGYDSTTSVVSILPENKTIMPAMPATLIANRQCDADSGWTNYYYDNNTPGYTGDDTLLLSLKMNGAFIGAIGDGTLQVSMIATAGAGSNTGIFLTNPLITNPSGYWVMNRYWNVLPTYQPTTPVGVRFYFNTQDLNDVNGSYPAHNLNYSDLIFYKTTGGNSDPTTNLAGATAITSIVNGSVPDTSHWVYNALSSNRHMAEFQVSHFSGGGGGGTGNGQTLPLRISDFNAFNKGKANLLQWTTCAQVKGFEIQRGSTATEFNPIGYVDAENIVCRAYQFTDNKPLSANNYYRLKIEDRDGKTSYSPIRKIGGNTGFDVAVYPNPVKDVLQLRFESENNESVQLQIISMEGKVLKSMKASVGAGYSVQSINAEALKTGSYFVKVISGDNKVMLKFEKM